MMRLIILAIGVWTTYRVIEENGFLQRRTVAALLPPPGAKARPRARRRRPSNS